jgi:hypothetical protein
LRVLARRSDLDGRLVGGDEPQAAVLARLRLDSGEDAMPPLGDAATLVIHHLPDPITMQPDRGDRGRVA